MKELSNVEIALLQIICEENEISGYEINRLVEERGYREWAGIGTTSIYVGLKKLLKQGLLDSYIDTKKEGKGPLPKKFKLTGNGLKQLKEELLKAISSTRERDTRFELAIAGFPLFSKEPIVKALIERKKNLKAITENVEMKFQSQGGEMLPLHVKALFKHPLILINEEIKFIDYLIEELKKHQKYERTK